MPSTLLAFVLAAAAAARPAVHLAPARARPGDAFLVLVRGAGAPRAEVAGRPVQFFAVPRGHAAVVGLPIETPAGPLPIEVTTDGGAGAAATLHVDAARFPERKLDVPQGFVEPPAPEVAQRQAEDRAAFAKAFAQPPSPPLFAGRFAWPRRDRVTAGYGEARTFNGVKPGQHYGLDLAGRVGAPVGAANDGRVVLVRDAWASGKSVVVFHGAGLFTTYFHLSRIRVVEGQAVKRGQRLGDVGSTGRASGPHLHWGVRTGELYVDPRSVLRLAFTFR